MATPFTRNLLLSIAVSTLPLAGCDLPAQNTPEQALYHRVIKTQSPDLAIEFLKKYPDSPLVRGVLTSLPPDALKRIPPAVIRLIPEATLASLPPDVRALLGLPVAKLPRKPVRASTGYNG